MGRPFYWQALIGSPSLLTNLEITASSVQGHREHRTALQVDRVPPTRAQLTKLDG